jgi:HAD superfamily hydrolase (TIGR01509 family)
MMDDLNLDLFEAIIFDFDGVIVDSENAQLAMWHSAFAHYSLVIDEGILLDTVGMKDEEIAKALVKDDNQKELRQHILNYKISKSNEMYRNNEIVPVKDAIRFIKHVSKTHILSIATNSRSNRAEIFCEQYGIKKYFKYIITGGGLLTPKPDPDIYFSVLKKLGLPEEKCIVIEDSIVGLKSARSAGLKTIGLANLYTKEQLNNYADYVVGAFNEIA